MPPTNDFVPFATGLGANVLTQSAYLANAQLAPGQQPGAASSALNNKALRQATFVASCFAQWLANTTGSDVLDDGTAANLIATITAAMSFNTVPSVTILTSTGSTAGYVFTISTSSTLAVGDTYTNNGHTYTVLAALTAQTGQVLFCSGASAPTSTGTLTRATGAGTASITFTATAALAVYTPPVGTKYLEIEGVGAGGGGGGSGNSGGGAAGTAGSNTLFGALMLVGNGGANAASNVAGAPGTASLGTGPAGVAMTGAKGHGVGQTNSAGFYTGGGSGGQSALGGGGAGASATGVGGSAVANSGSGGGGAGSPDNGSAGAGGSSGGYFKALITTVAASYYYCVGVKGTGQAAGTSGAVGGDGADGVIRIIEHKVG